MISILRDAINKIDSLENYYHMVINSIKEEWSKGLSRNQLGFYADVYFSSLFDKEEYDDEDFKDIREKVLEEYEVLNIDDIKNDNENRFVIYKKKNPEELERNGIEADVQKAAGEFRKYMNIPVIHGTSNLIMLITYFEEFVSALLYNIYKRFPKKYLDKQQVSYSEICNCGIEEVEQKIILREIEGKMRESYKEWFKLFEEHGIRLDRCEHDMKKLKEIYSRRNIFVHNSGKVNAIYLREVPDSEASIGDLLHIDYDYLKMAFTTVKTIIFCIMIGAVKLLRAEERKEYIELVFNFAFDKLSDEEYYLCKIVFLEIEQRSETDSVTKLMSKVNYWISEKELGNYELIKSDIDRFDVSALNDSFLLAKEILLDNYDDALQIIERLFPDDVSVHQLESWPLFIHLRNSEQYNQFKNKHKELFSNMSLEVSKQTCEQNEEVIESLEVR